MNTKIGAIGEEKTNNLDKFATLKKIRLERQDANKNVQGGAFLAQNIGQYLNGSQPVPNNVA